ncbi:MAG TPA: HAD-IA family hydrolase [Roseiflexaceae bacterium]|nr:HAD-IA family hydrolase [Roseiflexaceae bacterium]
MIPTRPAVVLFDLGGVLIEVAGAAQMVRWARLDSEQALWSRMGALPAFRHFEMGQITPQAFAAAVIAAFALPVDEATFLADFAGWPTGPLPGAIELLETIAHRTRLACLSNNNAVHWEYVSGMGLTHFFEPRFLSHELGMIKPDPAIYTYAVEQLGCPAASILFLDDKQENIDTARQVGMQARRTVGVGQARAHLRDVGIL